MKNLKIYSVALGLLTMSLGSCSNFLDTEMATSITESNYYKTPEDAYKALVGCYDGLQTVWAGGISLPVAAEVMSDNTYGGTGNTDRFNYRMIDEMDKGISASEMNMYTDNWAAYYKAVYRCNMLISKLDQIEWGTGTSVRPIYESEVRFLRAYLYFDMVRLWGNIPLVTAATTENVPQANPDEVYKLIAEDLKFGVTNLPASKYTENDPNYGRVTKYAAEALLGRVFLYYTGYYGKTDLVGIVTKTDALSYQEDIISNGGFSLVPDFSSLWPYSLDKYLGEGNAENVFSIRYTYTSDYNGNTDGNHWMVMIGIREYWHYPYGNGWGACSVNPNLYNSFSDNDSRKLGSIIAIDKEKIPFNNQPKTREYTGFYLKKYTPLVDKDGKSITVSKGATDFQIGQFQDYTSIRYADVLLMAAELGSPNAQSYFDAVRRRAYKTGYSQLPVTQSNIINERKLEFVGEGIRYWDLLRQGVDVAASAIAQTLTVQNGGVPTQKVILAAKVQETKGLSQIPYTQITLSNGMLKQNTGW